jgi:hypothetical protein
MLDLNAQHDLWENTAPFDFEHTASVNYCIIALVGEASLEDCRDSVAAI